MGRTAGAPKPARSHENYGSGWRAASRRMRASVGSRLGSAWPHTVSTRLAHRAAEAGSFIRAASSARYAIARPTEAAITGSVTMNWEAPTQNTDNSTLTNLAGYRITYGRSQTTLDQTINVTNPGLTTYVVPNLSSGTWYFAMYAYTQTGAESDASNVATKSVN